MNVPNRFSLWPPDGEVIPNPKGLGLFPTAPILVLRPLLVDVSILFEMQHGFLDSSFPERI